MTCYHKGIWDLIVIWESIWNYTEFKHADENVLTNIWVFYYLSVFFCVKHKIWGPQGRIRRGLYF